MIHGLDTGFLAASELLEHTEHVAARGTLARLLAAGDAIAIAPQVLAEFIHIATDSRRLSQPLTVTTAVGIAEQWWTARQVLHVFPDDVATGQFLRGCGSINLDASGSWIRSWLPHTNAPPYDRC